MRTTIQVYLLDHLHLEVPVVSVWLLFLIRLLFTICAPNGQLFTVRVLKQIYHIWDRPLFTVSYRLHDRNTNLHLVCTFYTLLPYLESVKYLQSLCYPCNIYYLDFFTFCFPLPISSLAVITICLLFVMF